MICFRFDFFPIPILPVAVLRVASDAVAYGAFLWLEITRISKVLPGPCATLVECAFP